MPEPLPVLPRGATALFVGIVLLVLLAIGAGAWVNASRLGFPRSGARRLALDLVLGLVAWLGLTGVVAAYGVFLEFDAQPPRIGVALLLPVVAVFLLITSRRIGGFLLSIPLTWLIAVQLFRVPVEIVLWMLAETGALSPLLTFEGNNFDILIGASAPGVCYLLARGVLPLRWVGWWNLIGVILLANVVVHGLLSAPTPWQVIETEPATTFAARYPFIWLPTFLVPFALFSHLLSLRIIARSRPGDSAGHNQPLGH
jgi:hypothetical protein